MLYAITAIAIVLALKYLHVQELLKVALNWIDDLGPWGPAVFVVLYIVAEVLFVPALVLTVSAEAVFGVVVAFRVRIGATLGATGISRPRRRVLQHSHEPAPICRKINVFSFPPRSVDNGNEPAVPMHWD